MLLLLLLLLPLLLLLHNLSNVRQLRRMAVEAVALLQAGLLLPPCIPTPEITTPNPLISFPTGLLSEAVEAASAVISRNPHLAIMF